MRPPCELVQREYLPLIRSSLAKNLASLGHSQNQIADALGITQAAVSKYLNQNEGSQQLLSHVSSLTSKLADSINPNSISSDGLVKEVCASCMALRIGGDICTMHRAMIPSLGEADCQICSQLLGGSDSLLTTRAGVLEDIQTALQLIQQSSVFSHLVPQVRANLVVCDEDASSIADVAGIPGRITIIEGRAHVLQGPRFGASTHTASLLLEMKKSWSHVRACLCISGNSMVIKAAKSQKVRILQLDSSESDHTSIAKSAKAKMNKTTSKSAIGIHVPGGMGVEPILYVFGRSAKGLGKLAEKMGDNLMKQF
ncbi:MAG: thiamine-phosphate synthase family protein [Candidatus Thorarchaeota archaeon]|jgi:predicted fused transcriptional regulator/phosphomethylpyrimidine kinase/predicted transcriptional regulator